MQAMLRKAPLLCVALTSQAHLDYAYASRINRGNTCVLMPTQMPGIPGFFFTMMPTSPHINDAQTFVALLHGAKPSGQDQALLRPNLVIPEPFQPAGDAMSDN